MFTEPIQFEEALDQLRSKKAEPTFLTSNELSRLPVEWRNQSFFSARQMDAELLNAFQDSVDKIVSGKSSNATQISDLHDLMDKMGHAPGDGGITDEYSDARLKLILDQNVKSAQGYGQWKESNTEGALTAFPAQELIRFSNREVPREWFQIWQDAADELGDDTTATDPDESGRMVAMKNDPIWLEISDFGNPWPPFKFNSGMGVVDVKYSEAVDLGVMDAEDDPLPLDENDEEGYDLSNLAAGVADMAPVLAGAFQKILSAGFSIVQRIGDLIHVGAPKPGVANRDSFHDLLLNIANKGEI